MKKLAIMGAALALAVGTAYAEKGALEKQQEKGGALNNETSFRVMDKNNDGYLSKAEAAGNPDLAKIDTHNASETVSKKTDDKAASGGTKPK